MGYILSTQDQFAASIEITKQNEGGLRNRNPVTIPPSDALVVPESVPNNKPGKISNAPVGLPIATEDPATTSPSLRGVPCNNNNNNSNRSNDCDEIVAEAAHGGGGGGSGNRVLLLPAILVGAGVLLAAIWIWFRRPRRATRKAKRTDGGNTTTFDETSFMDEISLPDEELPYDLESPSCCCCCSAVSCLEREASYFVEENSFANATDRRRDLGLTGSDRTDVVESEHKIATQMDVTNTLTGMVDLVSPASKQLDVVESNDGRSQYSKSFASGNGNEECSHPMHQLSVKARPEVSASKRTDVVESNDGRSQDSKSFASGNGNGELSHPMHQLSTKAREEVSASKRTDVVESNDGRSQDSKSFAITGKSISSQYDPVGHPYSTEINSVCSKEDEVRAQEVVSPGDEESSYHSGASFGNKESLCKIILATDSEDIDWKESTSSSSSSSSASSSSWFSEEEYADSSQVSALDMGDPISGVTLNCMDESIKIERSPYYCDLVLNSVPLASNQTNDSESSSSSEEDYEDSSGDEETSTTKCGTKIFADSIHPLGLKQPLRKKKLRKGKKSRRKSSRPIPRPVFFVDTELDMKHLVLVRSDQTDGVESDTKEHAPSVFADIDNNDIPEGTRDLVSPVSDRTDVIESDERRLHDSESFASMTPLGLEPGAETPLSLLEASQKKKPRKGKKPRRQSTGSILESNSGEKILSRSERGVSTNSYCRISVGSLAASIDTTLAEGVEQKIAETVDAILKMNATKLALTHRRSAFHPNCASPASINKKLLTKSIAEVVTTPTLEQA